MVNVAVDDGRLSQPAIALQAADGDGDVIEQAEPFAMIGKRMVQAAAEVHHSPVLQRELCGHAGAAGHQLEALHELRQPR